VVGVLYGFKEAGGGRRFIGGSQELQVVGGL